MTSRRIFIGDVQGCRDEFEDLLGAVRYDPSSDVLHPVGDLVNRGPDSVGSLRLAKELGARPLLGNHDVHLLRQAADPDLRGNRRTLRALREAPDGDELLAWLGSLPLVLSYEDVIAVHAGIHPGWDDPLAVLSGRDPLDRSDDFVEFAVRARTCNSAGQTPKKEPAGGAWPPPPPPAEFQPWDHYWREREGETRTVVFGHWARRGLVNLERTRGLDTGCVYGGKLTAWIPEEDRFVAVDAHQVWYETS